MGKIQSELKRQRLLYERRYLKYTRKCKEDPKDLEAIGHLRECAYVLMNIFYLTPKQLKSLEVNEM